MSKIYKRIFTFALTVCLLTTSFPVMAEDVSVSSNTEVQSAESVETVSENEETVENVEDAAITIIKEENNEISEAINTEIVAEGILAQLNSELELESTEASEDESISMLSEDSEEEEEEEEAEPAESLDPQIGENQIGIRVPEGFAVEFGYQQAYKHTYIGETTEKNNVWVYDVPGSKVYFYRVYSLEPNNDAVTYWGWLTTVEYKSAVGNIIEVTEENLNLNNDRNADTVDEYLTNNKYDTQDILITGNADGYVNLQIGETWTLNCYRMWEIIESFMNANISQPDFHIEIISPDGTPSDCIEITKNTGDGSANTVTAVKEGQAILKITYDAVTVDSAMGGSNFSAIAPENTALFVITVGNNATVNDGIELDSEVDIQYYTGDNGAVVVATPDEGTKVDVARCVYDENGNLQLTRFSDTGVEVNEDGTVTVVGLTEGSSVIRVTDSEGNSAYQVIKAKSINFSIQDMEGNTIDAAEHEFVPSEQVKIVADKFYDIFMKSAGVYNGSSYLTFTLKCKDADGNELSETFKSKENAAGWAISYDQASNPVYRTVDIVIPEKWDGESEISLDCDIYRNTRFGMKLTGHRSVYKNTGMTKVNGYMVQTTTAATTVDAVDINDVSEFVKDPNTTPVLDLIGTEILTGDVTSYDNAKVEYKNK